MIDNKVCTGACLFGKCPYKTCIKYQQGNIHKPARADMSILTSGNLPRMKTGKSGFGIAVDIGTTTVAAYLYDFEKGECIDIASTINPQISFGLDVISRIKYCRDKKGGLYELQSAVSTCINDLYEKLCAQHGIGILQVSAISITGNTTMLHLLAAVDPSSMGHAPFDVSDHFGYKIRADQIGLIGQSSVYLTRCITAFVGGDITSAILSSDMRQNSVSLLLDIGTNGEVALHAHGEILVSSTAAGPAFEGSELSCGMAAVSGAINSVYAFDGAIHTTVIGDKPPAGICGSGVIDAIALMKTSGAMDETGRIKDSPYTVIVDNAPAFVVTEDIYITQRDIRRIQTAKSAIAAGVLALIHSAGLKPKDITQVYLAGGFGNYMDEENAITVGLLAGEFRKIIKNIGNAAGVGAGMTLLSDEYLNECKRIADASRHIDLGTNAYFMEKYVDCMMF
ncbi:MAG: ASKHA domain-containing protein [Christensenellales bacterium]|jgi:uncharacterized 2Fe-2S/4Fe-4S cluster protein (DUF4445 family)